MCTPEAWVLKILFLIKTPIYQLLQPLKEKLVYLEYKHTGRGAADKKLREVMRGSQCLRTARNAFFKLENCKGRYFRSSTILIFTK